MFDIARYWDAGSVSEAIELLKVNPAAKIINGGTDVLIKLREGKMPDAELVCIQKIAELRAITLQDDGTIVIGGGATFSSIAESAIIRRDLPILAQAAQAVGGPQIRHIGTIGGNLCNGVTSADTAATLFTLDAQLQLEGVEGRRLIAISDFYQGPGKVNLNHAEILTAIIIPAAHYAGYGGHYIKYAMRNAMDIATLGVAVTCTAEDKKRIGICRIALGVAAPIPIRCPKAEAGIKGQPFSADILQTFGNAVAAEINPRTSWRASREFRLQLAQELSQRALWHAFTNAGGEVDGN